MKHFLALCVLVLLVLPATTHAHKPRLIETPGQHDVIPLSNPTISQALYGTLEGYPHMYEFATKESLEFFTEVLVPDIEGARNNVSGILLRVNGNGSVTEVARVRAREASWEAFYEPFGGDQYRRGSQYRGTLEPGLYRLEVSTPDNIGKYVLSVGTEESFVLSEYVSLVQDIVRVKHFFGKSTIRVVESPFVYVPLLGVVAIGGGVWLWRYRKRKGRMV